MTTELTASERHSAASQPPNAAALHPPAGSVLGPRSESAPETWKDFFDRWRASILSDDAVLQRHKVLMADVRLTVAIGAGTICVGFLIASAGAGTPFLLGASPAGIAAAAVAIRKGWKSIAQRRAAARQKTPADR